MIILVQEFLLDTLGIFFDMTSENFNRFVADGMMVAQILFIYNIIDSRLLKLIKPTKDLQIARTNFYYIRVWCKLIGINIDNNMITEITECKGISSIKLIYHIFVQLAVKLDFIPHTEEIRAKFQVETVKEEEEKSDICIQKHFEYPILPRKEPEHISLLKPDKHKTIFKNRPGCSYQLQNKEVLDKKFQIWKSINRKSKINPQFQSFLMELDYGKFSKAKCATSVDRVEEYRRMIKEKKKSIIVRKQYPKLVVHHVTESLIESLDTDRSRIITNKVLKNSHFEKLIASKNQDIVMLNQELYNHNLENSLEILDGEEQLYLINSMQSYFETMIAEVLKNSQIKRHMHLNKVFDEAKYGIQHADNIDMCLEIMILIVDGALGYGYVSMINEKIIPCYLSMQYKMLFIKGVSIFQDIDDLNLLLEEEEDYPEHLKKPIAREQERKKILVEGEFQNYLSLTDTWNATALMPDFTLKTDVNIILSHIVHQLLLTKYPIPDRPGPEVILPEVEFKSILIGLNEYNSTQILEFILKQKNIKLIQIEKVINSCIEAYEKEAKNNINFDCENVLMTEEFFQTNQNNFETLRNPNPRWEILKEPKFFKKEIENLEEEEEDEENESDQSSGFPYKTNELKSFSKKARYGKILLGILDAGEKIPDELLINVLIEELLENIPERGWVLHNFPATYNQVILLEEKLTGLQPPKQEGVTLLDDLMEIPKRRPLPKNEVKDLDPNRDLRNSKLFPNYSPTFNNWVFKSYFDMYLKIDSNAENWPKINSYIEEIYRDQNILFKLNYKELDHKTFLLVMDLIANIKTSQHPFNTIVSKDNCKYIHQGLIKEFKKYSGEIEATKFYDNKLLVNKEEQRIQNINEDLFDLHNAIQDNDLWQKKCHSTTDDSVEEEQSTIEDIDQITISEESKFMPGRPDWVFIDGDLSPEFKITLASIWEIIENNYITQMQINFCFRRISSEKLILKNYWIRNYIRSLNNAEDERQKYLHKYQENYNYIYNGDELWRRDKEIKWEFHMRATEMQKKLLHLAKKKYDETESQRKKIIGTNVSLHGLSYHTNTFIRNAQIETYLFINSLQFLNDYYSASLHVNPLGKIQGFKVPMINLQLFNSNFKVEIDKDEIEFNRQFNLDYFIKFNEILLDKAETGENGNPFCFYLTSVFEYTRKKGDEVISKIIREIKTLQESLRKKSKLTPSSLNQTTDVFLEWLAAIENEHIRFSQRLTIIHIVSYNDVFLIENRWIKFIHDMKNEISDRYLKEVLSIQKLLYILRKRIENEMPFKYELKLKHGRCMMSRKMLYIENPEEGLLPVDENFTHFGFTVCQLKKFHRIMRRITTNFVSRVELLRLISKLRKIHINEFPRIIFPYVWTILPIYVIDKILIKCFGETEFIEPKQFIIVALNLPSPTIDDILSYRQLFRNLDLNCTELIHVKDYFQTKLWFEKDNNIPENIKYKYFLAKNLIFIMYRVDKYHINYVKMLLGFCRDEIPELGLVKALSLVMGRFVVNSDYDYVEPTMSNYSEHENSSNNDFNPFGLDESQKKSGLCEEDKDSIWEEVLEDSSEEEEYSGFTKQSINYFIQNLERLSGIREELISHGCDLSVYTNTLSTISSSTSTKSQLLMEEEDTSQTSASLSLGSNLWTDLIPLEALLIVINNCAPWLGSSQIRLADNTSFKEMVELLFKDSPTNSVDSIILLKHPIIRDVFSKNLRFKQCNIDEITKQCAMEVSNLNKQATK